MARVKQGGARGTGEKKRVKNRNKGKGTWPRININYMQCLIEQTLKYKDKIVCFRRALIKSILKQKDENAQYKRQGGELTLQNKCNSALRNIYSFDQTKYMKIGPKTLPDSKQKKNKSSLISRLYFHVVSVITYLASLFILTN